MGELGELRPVDGGADVVNFAAAAARRDMRAEAAALVAAHGRNPYSDFILRQGCRPDCNQASAIGRLMGIRVRAADGSLQPRRTKAEQATERLAKGRRKTEGDYLEQVLRLRGALVSLANNEDDPAAVIPYIDPMFGDDSVIREHLDRAVKWINRFAEEWGRDQESRGGPQQI
jgi:hypothetical protein